MRRWLLIPDRIDVILPPRRWRVRLYPRGIKVMATGHLNANGAVVLDTMRFGPPMKAG